MLFIAVLFIIRNDGNTPKPPTWDCDLIMAHQYIETPCCYLEGGASCVLIWKGLQEILLEGRLMVARGLRAGGHGRDC